MERGSFCGQPGADALERQHGKSEAAALRGQPRGGCFRATAWEIRGYSSSRKPGVDALERQHEKSEVTALRGQPRGGFPLHIGQQGCRRRRREDSIVFSRKDFAMKRNDFLLIAGVLVSALLFLVCILPFTVNPAHGSPLK